jgi:peptide/nickel transport system substrate-binding protein
MQVFGKWRSRLAGLFKMKKVRVKKYLSKIRMMILVILVILVACIFCLFFDWEIFWGRYKEVPLTYGTFVEGMVGQPQILNPLFSQSDIDRDLTKLIFSQLLARNSAGRYEGDLAEKFSAASDGKSISLTLRKNAKWHNGKNITADDIVFSYGIVKRPDYSGPFARLLQNITIEKKDERNLILKSTKPSANLLAFAELPIIPKQTLAKNNLPLYLKFSSNPIGSGPFKFQRSVISNSGTVLYIELLSNPDYFRGEPYLKKIILRFFSSEQELKEAVLRGEISGMLNLSLHSDSLGLSVHSCYQPAYIAAFFNMGKPYFAKKEFREALNSALDRKKMEAELGKEFGRAISGPIFGKDYTKITAADIDMAKKKILDARLGKITLKIVTVNEERFVKLAEFLKKSWAELGIEVSIKAKSKEKLEQVEIPEHDFDVLLFGQSFGFGADEFTFWHSSQIASGGNASSWQNKEADKLLSKSRESVSQAERTKDLEKVAQLIMNEKPAVFLFQPSFDYGVKVQVKGIKLTLMRTGADRFANVEQWYVKTKRIRIK